MGKAPLKIKHFSDADESDAFEAFLSQYWPNWRDGEFFKVFYHHLKSGFNAGWKMRSRRDRAKSRNRA